MHNRDEGGEATVRLNPDGLRSAQSVAWHAVPSDRALADLGTSLEGLTSAEAARRRAEVGPNRLEPTPPRAAWRILVDQFRSVVVALLAGASGVAWLTGDPLDAAAIGVVLALNAAIGFGTEWRARRAMEALLTLEVDTAHVRRPGGSDAGSSSDAKAAPVVETPSSDLVPGDVVELGEGDGVPADLRLIEAVELTVVEAPLTGESVPVTKHPEAELVDETPLPERDTMAWMGTTVAGGRAVGVVVATGARTQVGRIGTLVEGIPDEETPLERRLDGLGRRLAAAAFGVAGLVGLVGWLRGWAAHEMIEASLALAVAAVPEGLPAVATITLAVGLRKMARRDALIRRLPAVEALGAATVVCTDKTGTLTRGRMEVGEVVGFGDGDGGAPAPGLAPDAAQGAAPDLASGVAPGAAPGAALDRAEPDSTLLRAALLGTRAQVTFGGAGASWTATGDPTEAAVVAWALQHGGDEAQRLAERWSTEAEVPFSSERRFAASLHRGTAERGATRGAAGAVGAAGAAATAGAPAHTRAEPAFVAVMRGAPEAVAQRCDLDDEARARVLAENERMAAEGLRVIALAEWRGGAESGTSAPAASGSPDAMSLEPDAMSPDVDAPSPEKVSPGPAWQPPESGWRLLALLGLVDPPAEGVRETIAAFHEAGIETVMITGDQAATGRAIARSLGMDEGRVHARVSPEEKLRLVEQLQAEGGIVAMLGDGVNDAAALRKADVGVAMGQRGTSVAREVADVILLDDRFPTLAVAVREGRVIHDNIRKFVFYLFSCNLAEILILLGAGLAGWPLPLLPLQILWLNLVTDTFPALALAFEPAGPQVMQRKPRPPQAELLSRHGIGAIGFYALLITGVTMVAYVVGAGGGLAGLGRAGDPDSVARARTFAFTALALAQLFHIGNARGMGRAMWKPAAFATNRWAIGAVSLSVLLQVIAVHLPAAQRVLGTVALGTAEWAGITALALIPTVVGQLLRTVRQR